MYRLTQHGLAFVPVVVAASTLPAQQRLITQNDFYAFKWVADPQISPDGKRVAYVLVTVNPNHSEYETRIWSVAIDGASHPHQLTAGLSDVAPRWSPDSRTLAFVRSKEKARPQIYLLSMSSGEAMQLTHAPRGASPAVWSPDRKTIAFTGVTKPSDLRDTVRVARGGSAGDPADSAGAESSDVKVTTRAVFRFNGAGYLDPTRHRHIWTIPVDLEADPPTHAWQVTSGNYDDGDMTWSPDGTRLYFTSDRVAEPYYYPPPRRPNGSCSSRMSTTRCSCTSSSRSRRNSGTGASTGGGSKGG